MSDDQTLGLYAWATGVCFRHPLEGEQPTALVKTLHPRAGGDEEVRACRECILQLEDERARAAQAAGRRHAPGPCVDDTSQTRASGLP